MSAHSILKRKNKKRRIIARVSWLTEDDSWISLEALRDDNPFLIIDYVMTKPMLLKSDDSRLSHQLDNPRSSLVSKYHTVSITHYNWTNAMVNRSGAKLLIKNLHNSTSTGHSDAVTQGRTSTSTHGYHTIVSLTSSLMDVENVVSLRGGGITPHLRKNPYFPAWLTSRQCVSVS
jgi:hypothetical protein